MINNKLSPSQLEHYEREGFVLTGPLLDAHTLELLRAEEARFRERPLHEGGDAPGQLTIFRSQVANYSAIVRDFCTHGGHLDLVEQLLGPHIALWFNQFVTKFPDANSGKSEFPWHQDNGYVAIEPANNVTLWIALDDVGLQNGCVWVMPQSHKKGLLDHSSKGADSWFLDVSVEGEGVPAILKAGEGIAFTGLTLHRSLFNYSSHPRRGFFIEYAIANATYGPDKIPVVQSPDSWVVRGQLAQPNEHPI